MVTSIFKVAQGESMTKNWRGIPDNKKREERNRENGAELSLRKHCPGRFQKAEERKIVPEAVRQQQEIERQALLEEAEKAGRITRLDWSGKPIP